MMPHVMNNIVLLVLILHRRLGVAFKACLRYIHMRSRLDHVSNLESTVTDATPSGQRLFDLFVMRYHNTVHA
jgi:hypothetical protein